MIELQTYFNGGITFEAEQKTSGFLVGYDNNKKKLSASIGFSTTVNKQLELKLGTVVDKIISNLISVGLIGEKSLPIEFSIGLKQNNREIIECELGLIKNEKKINEIKIGLKENEIILLDFEITKILISPILFKLNYNENELNLEYLEENIFELNHEENEVDIIFKEDYIKVKEKYFLNEFLLIETEKENLFNFKLDFKEKEIKLLIKDSR